MKYHIKGFYVCAILFCCAIVFSSFVRNTQASAKLVMPYKKAGLTTEQAAAHLLNRFTYGPKPGEIEEVVKMGLGKWFKKQLDANLKEEELGKMLADYDAINFTNSEVDDIFPKAYIIRSRAIKEGFLHKDSVANGNRKYEREIIKTYMEHKGYRPLQELNRQFISQKILRAAYSNNQLQELMTDFWFNHFNVALSKNQCSSYVPAYERDVIRPNVFGSFGNLLLKTAQSPAMLMYLDNAASIGANMPKEVYDMGERMQSMSVEQRKKATQRISKLKQQAQQKKGRGGLNENYAREVMELHTLGVDGGYTQSDVTQVARILTGWTVAPIGERAAYGGTARAIIKRVGEENLAVKGFVWDGDFFFNIERHDNGEKTVLGRKFPAGKGYEEGVQLLDMLAKHPSTANFIAKKIAVRFVNDTPPKQLVERMAKTFSATKGDIKSVLTTMVNSPEFWSAEALREKTKSPFELAISAVRSLDAQITQPYQLYSWINKMGQQLYNYQAPTGFPDNGQYWINTGSLLNRMNFGLALASQRIPGVKIDLPALNHHREPESTEAALFTYSKLIMPQRELDNAISRLKPMLSDPNLQQKVATAAAQNNAKQNKTTPMGNEMEMKANGMSKDKVANGKKQSDNITKQQSGNNTMLAQVVGVIIGSPEFQRK